MRAPHRPHRPKVDPRTGEEPGEDLSRPPIVDPTDNGIEDPAEYVADRVKAQASEEVARLKAQYAKIRTPEGKLRRARFIGAVLGLKFEKYSIQQIAAILGVSQPRVLEALRQVRADATIADQLKRIDEQILPIVVDNIERAVLEGDLRTSMKIADGRGIFRTHKSIEAQITEQRIDIRLVVNRPAHMDPNTPLPPVKPGSIASGAPQGQRPDVSVVPVKVS